MDRKIKKICIFVVLVFFGFNRLTIVKAVSSDTTPSSPGASASCGSQVCGNTGTALAKGYKGFRIKFMKKTGTDKGKTKLVAANPPGKKTNTYYLVTQNYKKDYAKNKANYISSKNIDSFLNDVFSGADGNTIAQTFANYFSKSLEKKILKPRVKDMLYYVDSSFVVGDDVNSNLKDYYLEIRPVMVLNIGVFGSKYFYAGTIDEVIAKMPNPNKISYGSGGNNNEQVSKFSNIYADGACSRFVGGSFQKYDCFLSKWNVLKNFYTGIKVSKDTYDVYSNSTNNSDYSARAYYYRDTQKNGSIYGKGIIILSEFIQTGKIVIEKKDDAGKVVQGATFNLYDSKTKSLNKSCTTGNDGKCTFTNLAYGTYKVKETGVNTANYIMDSSTKSTTISASKPTQNLTFTNTRTCSKKLSDIKSMSNGNDKNKAFDNLKKEYSYWNLQVSNINNASCTSTLSFTIKKETDDKVAINKNTLNGIMFNVTWKIGEDGRSIPSSCKIGYNINYNKNGTISKNFYSGTNGECRIIFDISGKETEKLYITNISENKANSSSPGKNTLNNYDKIVFNNGKTATFNSSTKSLVYTVTNKKSCDLKLKDIIGEHGEKKPYSKSKLIELYWEESDTSTPSKDLRQLLNFENPKCEPLDEEYNENKSVSCLNVTINHSGNFSENDFSRYVETISLDGSTNGINTLYCRTNYNINSVSGTNNTEPVFSGQMHFKLPNSTIMAGNMNRTCFTVSNLSSDVVTTKIKPSLSEYIDTNPKLIGKQLTGSKSTKTIDLSLEETSGSIKNISSSGDKSKGTFVTKYEYGMGIKGIIPEVFVDAEGKKDDSCNHEDGKCKSLGYGVLSPLDIGKTSGVVADNYVFSVSLLEGNTIKNYSPAPTCNYSVKPQILCDGNKICAEFRTIDTEKPFLDKDGNNRNTMTNWCYDSNRVTQEDVDITDATLAQRYLIGLSGTIKDYYRDGQLDELDSIAIQAKIANLDTKCAYNNDLANYYIKEKTNSYNKKYDATTKTYVTGNGPKYKITLTKQVMDDIKNEAKTSNITYDDFNLECRDKNFNLCTDSTKDEDKVYNTSKLLTKLKNDNKLIINYSLKRNIVAH